jgi:hypothetical protein
MYLEDTTDPFCSWMFTTRLKSAAIPGMHRVCTTHQNPHVLETHGTWLTNMDTNDQWFFQMGFPKKPQGTIGNSHDFLRIPHV